MQPTFSKTSTHALHSRRRAATARAACRHLTGVSIPPSPLTASRFPPPRRVLSTRASTNEGWVLTPRHRAGLEPCAEARIRDRATKTVSTTEPLKNGGFPDPRRLPPVGSPVEPSAGPVHGERTVPASDVPSPVARNRFGLARPASLPAATESVHAEPTPPTDFCNRQRAWAHRVNDCSSHRTRCFGAFCWFGIFVSEPASGTASGADAPCARGQSRTGLQGPEPACAKIA